MSFYLIIFESVYLVVNFFEVEVVVMIVVGIVMVGESDELGFIFWVIFWFCEGDE